MCSGVCSAHKQQPKVGQIERQVAAAWGVACPAPRHGSQAPGVCSPGGHTSSLALGAC